MQFEQFFQVKRKGKIKRNRINLLKYGFDITHNIEHIHTHTHTHTHTQNDHIGPWQDVARCITENSETRSDNTLLPCRVS